MSEEIDKTEWKTKNPKIFEYDSKNNIVDIFVKEDPDCPFPFHKDDWWHQGFYFENFIIYINSFFKRVKLPYTVMKNQEIETLDLVFLTLSLIYLLWQANPLTTEDPPSHYL